MSNEGVRLVVHRASRGRLLLSSRRRRLWMPPRLIAHCSLLIARIRRAGHAGIVRGASGKGGAFLRAHARLEGGEFVRALTGGERLLPTRNTGFQFLQIVLDFQAAIEFGELRGERS